MEHLELLSKVLRYAGLNLNPQIIQLVLDEPTSTLIKNLDATLTENPNPSLQEIDAIVLEIQEVQAAAAEAAAVKTAPAKGKKATAKLDKK
tara:strand:+ start:75140 stop:75412 length:273 start_codon:yes stop_codon:yes gene_type:complete